MDKLQEKIVLMPKNIHVSEAIEENEDALLKTPAGDKNTSVRVNIPMAMKKKVRSAAGAAK